MSSRKKGRATFARPLWDGLNYQEEPTAARWGASSRTTGTTKAWLVGRRRTVVARTVMVGFSLVL
jgi:hypothetical protein